MPRTRANNGSSSNENTEALSEFFRTLGTMTQMMKDSMPAPATPALGLTDSGLIERFKRLAPPTFFGHEGVEKAERWRRKVEKIFEVLHCTDGQKYLSDSIHERKEVKFIELQQGNLSVEQYAAKFAELSRYAPHIINTEARKVNKFERGLRPDIRGRVISANLKTFSPLVELAMKIKRDCEESRFEGNRKMGPAQFGNLGRKTRPPPRKSFKGRYNQGNKKIRKTFTGGIRKNQRPTCPYCGKDNHYAVEC
ncbi:uncharacterized protein LOC105421792 [Amborella trichopoda]|uniref:uncharacterized protein LOC105421792 n=1 Tax=Amborella trichopoda TaxID=13333 RepID=UPI0005D43637|nr:uncharacterized protein LOC105421792 [Amborella trichopoda]|eukprot:XP_011628886.1 uncharacterized protein LOC105421792 [Amborella trichopoda]